MTTSIRPRDFTRDISAGSANVVSLRVSRLRQTFVTVNIGKRDGATKN
jgi:hypothetical protein